MCIACCSIIRTINLSEPPLVLISSDNRSSTVNGKCWQGRLKEIFNRLLLLNPGHILNSLAGRRFHTPEQKTKTRAMATELLTISLKLNECFANVGEKMAELFLATDSTELNSPNEASV